MCGYELIKHAQIKWSAREIDICLNPIFLAMCMTVLVMMTAAMPMLMITMRVIFVLVVVMFVLVVVMFVLVMGCIFYLTNPCGRSGHFIEVE
jgi:hypothetical protein